MEGASVTCATWVDATNLVTGSSDHVVRLWAYASHRRNASNSSGAGTNALSLSHVMRAHTNEVMSVAASRAWSLVVSGSRDGSAAVWDLNRGLYIRSIWHGENGGEDVGVYLVAVNESTVRGGGHVDGSLLTC